MDMERATREAMDPNLRHKPRLLSDEELPSWLLKDEDEVRKLLHVKLISLSTTKTDAKTKMTKNYNSSTGWQQNLVITLSSYMYIFIYKHTS